jgi:hypothetical protein
MARLPLLVFLAALFWGAATVYAAPAPDLYTVSGIRIDATADSAIAARDLAMQQGRPAAWTKLFRRFTSTANWSKQPQLDDNTLLRLVRSFEVSNERRSTTRYLADLTIHFNAAAVRNLLRQSGVSYTEARSRPVLVIPVIAGKPGFDPMGSWATAWKSPLLEEELVPFVLPMPDAQDDEILSRPDPAQLDWASLAPMARRANATDAIIAIASEDSKTVQMIQISATARTPASFAYAQSTFAADAEAIAERAYEAWKTRSAVSYGTRARLTADVQFDSLDDWAKIRAQLGATRAVSDMDVIGLSLNEAEIELTYFGRPEQLRDALAQQNLQLINASGQFTLQLAGRAAAASP